MTTCMIIRKAGEVFGWAKQLKNGSYFVETKDAHFSAIATEVFGWAAKNDYDVEVIG